MKSILLYNNIRTVDRYWLKENKVAYIYIYIYIYTHTQLMGKDDFNVVLGLMKLKKKISVFLGMEKNPGFMYVKINYMRFHLNFKMSLNL